MNQFERPYTFDRVIRILISIAIVIGLYILVKNISGALLPFVLGWLLAYLVNPAVEFCQNRLKVKKRGLAILLSLVVIFGIIGGVIYAISPYIAGELSRFVEVVDRFRNESGQIQIIPASWIEFIRNNIDFDEIIHSLSKEDINSIITKMGSGVQWLFSGSVSIVGWIFMIFLVFIYMVFILVDYDKIVKGVPGILPPKYKNTIVMVFNDMKAAMNRYFRGQALVVICVMVLYAAGFRIIGLPLGILLGIFVGILNFVPYLQVVGFLPALLLCILKTVETGENFWVVILSCALVFIVVQVIQDGFIVPRIQGKMSGMNPAIILLSLSVWGMLLGFIGLLLAIPLTSLLMSYYDRVILKQKDLYQEEEMPPAE